MYTQAIKVSVAEPPFLSLFWLHLHFQPYIATLKCTILILEYTMCVNDCRNENYSSWPPPIWLYSILSIFFKQISSAPLRLLILKIISAPPAPAPLHRTFQVRLLDNLFIVRLTPLNMVCTVRLKSAPPPGIRTHDRTIGPSRAMYTTVISMFFTSYRPGEPGWAGPVQQLPDGHPHSRPQHPHQPQVPQPGGQQDPGQS